MEDKFFMWYDSDDHKMGPCYGPHYYGDQAKIGKKLYHNLEELLKMNIPDSLKKRLQGAKVGTKIKIHYLHSCGNLMVRRISTEEVSELNMLEKLNKQISDMQKEIFKLEEERNLIKTKLFKEKN